MIKDFCIILTCAHGELVQYVAADIKRLLGDNIKLIGVDGGEKEETPGGFDAFHKIKRGSHPQYIEELKSICIKQKVDLIIPWSDEEVETLSRSIDIFNDMECRLALPDLKTVDIITDKEKTYQFLKDAGIPVPYFIAVRTLEDLQLAIKDFRITEKNFVVKPATARGGRDVYIVDVDAKEAFSVERNRQIHCDLETFEKTYIPQMTWAGKLVVMEKMIPPSYDVDVLSWGSEVISIVPRKRFNPDGLPYYGYVMEVSERLKEVASNVSRLFNLHYLYDIDFMCNQEGEYYVMEINPRPSGSIAYAHYAGVPVMALLVELFRDEKTTLNTSLKKTIELDHEALLKEQTKCAG